MPLITDLLNLFKVDGQLRALRSRLESAQRYLDAQTRELHTLTERKAELTLRRKQVQANIGNVEVEIKSIDERLEKLRGELNSSVNNKQYTAVLTELNTIKEQRSKTEDRVLAEMEQIEGLDAELEGIDEKIAERSKVRDVASTQLQQRQADVGERVSQLEAERSIAASNVAGADLEKFDHLAYVYDGEAMACVEEISRRSREYSCGACNMQIPFEQVSSLMSNGEIMVCCASCHRILYMAEETRGSLAKK